MNNGTGYGSERRDIDRVATRGPRTEERRMSAKQRRRLREFGTGFEIVDDEWSLGLAWWFGKARDVTDEANSKQQKIVSCPTSSEIGKFG